MPTRLQLPLLSCRNDRLNEGRQVLGGVNDSNQVQSKPRCRRPHLTTSARTAPEDRPSSSIRGGSEGCLHALPSRKVRMSDTELVQRARSASRASRRGRLLRVPSVMWDCKDISGFALLSRRSGTSGENFEVLTTGEVACRPCDIEPLLHPQTESDYNAVAQGFLGDQFIYGSVVHDVHPRGFGVDSALNTYCDDDSVDLDDDDFIAVKTASFARSRRFTRNEEWCFIEHFQSNPATPSSPFGSNASSTPSSVSLDDSPGFTIVMSSIPDGELSAGKMADGQVVQLHGILAAYLVEPLPQTVGCQGPRVRVSFHATFNAAEPNRERYADSQTVRERLLSIARSLHRLPELVQKRQCQRSQMSLGGGEVGQERETPNSRCIACTKRLRMRLLSAPTRRSKRCQMCLYRACASCWSKEKVSTFNGHSTTMAVCRRCHENIGSRDFSHIHLTC